MTRLPSHPQPPAPQHTQRLRPKTYSVAVYLVIAVVVFQVLMVISVFYLRAMVVTVNVNKLPKASGKPSAVTPPIPTPPVAPPIAPTPALPPRLPDLPSLNTAMPHPALLAVPASSDPIEQINSLNDQAQALMRQNDLHSAIDLLIKAEDIDPPNPATLKSLAEAYYLANNSVKSKQYWQRLVDLGPGVGTVYGVAKDHVVLLGNHDADPLREPSSLPRLVYIDQVEKTPVESRNGQPQFHLRAVLVRKDPDMPSFEQKKLRPFVIFYQQLADGRLVPDLNQHGGAFESTFLFWGKKNREPFGVDYAMPTPGLPGPNNTTTGKYYGFVIGIYYDNTLQDARSEPSDLVTRMPLPAEIE